MSLSSSESALVASAQADTTRFTAAETLTLGTASATCSLIVLDTNVVAVSLPAIARSFHASFAEVEWVVSAYMVAFAACLLPAGAIADRVGRKKMLLAGLLVFIVASLGCGLAPSALMLNLARAIKGVGAAMLLTSALAVIANTFQDGPVRIRAWAIWGTCMGLATTVAPMVGGVITQWAGWRWVFLLNLPVCTVLVWCSLRAIPDSRNLAAGPIDIAGSLLFASALAMIIWALIDAPAAGWGSELTIVRMAGGTALCIAFVLVERARSHAMVDLTLFGQARFVAAVLAMFGYAACAQVMMTYLPLYLQNAFDWTAASAGLGMLPFALAMVVGPYLGALLSHKLSTHVLLAFGLILVGVGDLLTAYVAGGMHYSQIALAIAVTGCGAGILNGNTQKAIMACVPTNRTGMASGISTTTRFTAIVISVGVLGAVLSANTRMALRINPQLSPALKAHLGEAFLSQVLAGDVQHTIGRLPHEAGALVSVVARGCFTYGFAAALNLAGLLAVGVAFTVGILGARRAG